MVKFYDSIEDRLMEWAREQKIFFVGTAPLTGKGTVNVSPKGHDCLRILGPNRVCYLDLTGSGIETQSHLFENGNGRITFMFMALEGGPKIMRFFGYGRVVLHNTPEFTELLEEHYKGSQLYEAHGKRGIIMADIHKVSTSCGFAVPFYEYKGERMTLVDGWAKRSPEAIEKYWVRYNTKSLDGLPGMPPEAVGLEASPVALGNHSWSVNHWITAGSNLITTMAFITGVTLGAALVAGGGSMRF